MIYITIFQNQGKISGFNSIGHAGFADEGQDVVCAGVSALIINTINSIENLTATEFQLLADEEGGLIDVTFSEGVSPEAELLMNSMILGLQGIQNDYGKEFLSLNFKEV